MRPFQGKTLATRHKSANYKSTFFDTDTIPGYIYFWSSSSTEVSLLKFDCHAFQDFTWEACKVVHDRRGGSLVS